MNRHIQPDGLVESARFGFTHVVTSDRPRTVYVAGQTAYDPNGRPVGGPDHAEQASVALENLRLALQAAGAGPADVVMMRAYIVGLTPEIAKRVARRVAQFYEGHAPPASTWVGVEALLHPDFLIEIEAVASVET